MSGCKIAAIVAAVVSLMLMCFGGVIAVGLLLVAIPKAREAANRANCQSNLRQIGIAVHQFNMNLGYMPSALNYPDGKIRDASGAMVTPSVFWLLLPNLELDAMYNGGMASQTRIPVKYFICPSDPSNPSTSGLASSCYVLSQPIFSRPTASLLVAMADGTSQTVMGSERLQTCGVIVTRWGDPVSSLFAVPGLAAPEYQNTSTGTSPALSVQTGANQASCVPGNVFQSAHPNGVQVLMGDGRVTILPTGYAPTNLGYFCTPCKRSLYSNAPVALDF